jgi:tetratricopeptide (TPR) repeat protein
VAVAVFGGLAGAYLLLKGVTGSSSAATPTAVARATSTPPPLLAPGGNTPAAAPSPTTAGTGQATAGGPAACGAGLTTASNQRQQHALADAATTLEGLRASGCDVTEPLYDVYLALGRALADADKIDEAITRFDQALQVKGSDDARNARAIAAAYRDGKGAVDRQSWDDAIQKLQQVRQSSPTYAGGNAARLLATALTGKGDDLRRQGKLDEALALFNQASELQPNDAALAARIHDTQAERDGAQAADAGANQPPSTTAPPAIPPAAPVADAPAELERVARSYYDTLDAALDSGHFEDAYAFLSAAARQQQTLTQFAGRFANTQRIALRTTEGARIQGSRGFLIAHTYTETSTAQGLVRSCSQVSWELVREAQGWRRDIVSGSGNEQGERC